MVDDSSGPGARRRRSAPSLAEYRDAVDCVITTVVGDAGAGASGTELDRLAERLGERMGDRDLAAVLGAVPGGTDAVAKGLADEVRCYRPSDRSSASDLPSLVRIYLLSQIDAAWWGSSHQFENDDDVLGSGVLVDLDPLRRRRLLEFRYRPQPNGLPGRARDWAQRRALPNRRPRTSGLRFVRARPEVVALLNDLGREFAAATPSGTPPLWVTSLVRSIRHQLHLRSLGYAAVLPSAHCAGYAVDVEMRWFQAVGGGDLLAGLLLDRQVAGQVNVIDEGQAWHVCVSPAACDGLRRKFAATMGA